MSEIEWKPIRWTPNGEWANWIFIETVRGRAGEKYAVRDGNGDCINKEGEYEPEPMPSNRDDDFLQRCRFDTIKEASIAFSKALLRSGVGKTTI